MFWVLTRCSTCAHSFAITAIHSVFASFSLRTTAPGKGTFGFNCPTNLLETKANTCTAGCVTACEQTAWSAWSACSINGPFFCGAGTSTRTRDITSNPKNGGAACGANEETKACTVDATSPTNQCPVNCAMTEWAAWNKCSTLCGTGSQSRIRSVAVRNKFAGTSCGALNETQACTYDLAKPGNQCPVKCVQSAWAPYGKCSTTCFSAEGAGTQIRTRTVTTPEKFGGGQCGASSEKKVGCTDDTDCTAFKVNCAEGAWTAWSSCLDSTVCGAGNETRTREITTQPEHGGTLCGDLEESKKCTVDTSTADNQCPVDCAVDTWSAWTDCKESSRCTACTKSTKCTDPGKITAPGTTTRYRNITVEPLFGGGACAAQDESKACVVDDTTAGNECPIDATVSAYGAFASCSTTCGKGNQSKVRTVTQMPVFGGSAIPTLVVTQVCTDNSECPVDCKTSVWGNWSPCSTTCGDGTRIQQRTVEIAPQFNGAPCGALSKSEACQMSSGCELAVVNTVGDTAWMGSNGECTLLDSFGRLRPNVDGWTRPYAIAPR